MGSGTTQVVDDDREDSVNDDNLSFMVEFVKNFVKSSGIIIALT